MKTISFFPLTIMILFLQINGEIMSVEFNIYSQCQCEELVYESECEYHPECYYANDNRCISRACDGLKTNKQCLRNQKCGWDLGKCSEFDSCTKFAQHSDCTNYNNKCIFDIMTNTCNTYDKLYQKTCSETNLEHCTYAKDGICYESDGKCKKLNACEDVEYDDIACSLAFNYCYANTVTKKCESLIGCKNAERNYCRIAAQEIGSSNFYICQYGDDDQCEDWDVSDQSIKTCHSGSLEYYHWHQYTCIACSSQQGYFSVLLNLILLSIL